jgi:hypothetical protein
MMKEHPTKAAPAPLPLSCMLYARPTCPMLAQPSIMHKEPRRTSWVQIQAQPRLHTGSEVRGRRKKRNIVYEVLVEEPLPEQTTTHDAPGRGQGRTRGGRRVTGAQRSAEPDINGMPHSSWGHSSLGREHLSSPTTP